MKTEFGLVDEWDEFADTPLLFSRGGSARVHNGGSFRTGSSSPCDTYSVEPSTADTDEGRLSRALQTWMPDHVIRSLNPREKPPPEPVFSGRLGKQCPVVQKTRTRTSNNTCSNNKHGNTSKTNNKYGNSSKSIHKHGNSRKQGNTGKHGQTSSSDRRCKTAPIRRVPSNDSITTSLSLLTCSSTESKQVAISDVVNCAPKRHKRKVTSRASTKSSEEPTVSKWIELSSKRVGVLDRLNRSSALRTDVGLIGGDDLSGESEAFQMFDKDEQISVHDAGRWTGIKYVNKSTLKRCSSAESLVLPPSIQTRPEPRLQRTLSSSATTGFGRPLDLADLRRERLARLADEQARQQIERERRRGRRGGVARKLSSTSMVSSLVGAQSGPSQPAAASVSAVSQSAHSSDNRAVSPSDRGGEGPATDTVTVWKGDREILEIDLKKELTERVKRRITTTRTALKRATGMGDSNEPTVIVGTHEEFPKHIEEDFSHKPRIIQKMRISPHLSDVIHDDIQVRMGRPRYHEIRVSDLQQWNKGQALDRAHTNLKVFNWLHSLREADFQTHFDVHVEEGPDINGDLELLHVEAADEPDVKPLYRAYEVRIL